MNSGELHSLVDLFIRCCRLRAVVGVCEDKSCLDDRHVATGKRRGKEQYRGKQECHD